MTETDTTCDDDVPTARGIDIELRRDDDPAVVHLDDGMTEIVADHHITESGWLSVRDRDETTRKYPPSMVTEVRPIETTVVCGEDGENVHTLVLSSPVVDFYEAVSGGGLA